MNGHSFRISVVIPVHNEAEVLDRLKERLDLALSCVTPEYEIIFVDDGSTDLTFALLCNYHRLDPRYKIVKLARNFGQQTAISAGLHYASGDCAVIMDADLQDPPELIQEMIKYWKQDYQVVYAKRRRRKGNILKRIAYKVFYRFLKKLSSIEIPLDTGDFCLIDKVIVQNLRAMPERNRFVRGLRAWIGFRQIGVEFDRDDRFAGDVKLSLSKLIQLAMDGFFSFSFVPLRLASVLGFAVSAISFIAGVFVIVSKYVADYTPRGWTSTLVIIFFLGGIQLVTIGIIGEYIARIFDEVKGRPLFIESQKIGEFETEDPKPVRQGWETR